MSVFIRVWILNLGENDMNPLSSRRYTELVDRINDSWDRISTLLDLVIDELQYRKKERVVRKVHYKAMNQEDARLQAISDGYDVIFLEEIRENRWQVTVSL